MFSGAWFRRTGEAWLNVSDRTVVASIVGLVALVFCAIAVIDWLMFDTGRSALGIMLGEDVLASVSIFGFTYGMVHNSRRQRESLRREQRIVAETNHHIRNALELIQLSAQTTRDQQVIAQVSVAVERIQWALRELSNEKSFYQVLPGDPAAKVKRERKRKSG
jgi:hypothetical protein